LAHRGISGMEAERGFSGSNKMPDGNLLAHETSPYLLQHKDNPVHWRPWGPAALEEAERTGKPILLSIGYAACHWCHVMAHESFEDPATAAVMNRLFVNIKVDREERPDVDQIYMAALHALDEQGGWPLTMFLTPRGEPIWGGTYFPKESRYGRPAFVAVLEEVARLFREEPEKIATNRRHLLERLQTARASDALPLGAPLLDEAASRLLGLMDSIAGGTRGAPKFPQASLLAFLWRTGTRTGDARLRDIVRLTLRQISNGGIYDHIGGGFCRYSVDAQWLIPHFEKMLYDNAQLIERLTYAWLETREPLFQRRVEETIDWLFREMRTEGAFAASLDADSEGEEGRFYVWHPQEVRAALGAEDGARFEAAYNITSTGNWEGKSIPNRLGNGDFNPAEDAELALLRRRLLDERERRPRPARDDKILADWNGLMIAALALAGWSFERMDWIAAARQTYAFITETMMHNGRLGHSRRAGRLLFPGFASDHAALTKAALALHHATQEQAYLDDAAHFMNILHRHYASAEPGGYFMTADDSCPLIVRPRSLHDEAVPSATSLAADALIRLWHVTGSEDYRNEVDALLEKNSGAIGQNLFAAAGLLAALDLRLTARQIVVVLPKNGSAAPLLEALRIHWREHFILSVIAGENRLPPTHPAHGKKAIEGRATAYVCCGETCSLPVTEPADLVRLLGAELRSAI
jgi:uncharacterized protein YyaL (SSP411 family)